MGKIYIALRHTLLIILLLICAEAKANTTNYRQPQQYNYNQAASGTVFGLLNRIPRRYDKDTLINSGPGLLQESYFLLRRMGGTKKTPEQTTTTEETVMQETSQEEVSQIPEPQDPKDPELTENYKYQEQEIQTQTIKTQTMVNPNPQTVQMIPAPAPGYIIRYNQERGVYEEVREIPIQTIPAATE